MSGHHNSLGQPVGPPLPDWTPRPRPTRTALEGRVCRLEPLDAARHAADLYAAWSEDRDGRGWTYLLHEPFPTLDACRAWAEAAARADDPLFFAVVDRETGRALGVASYLRIDPANGVIEVGHIHLAPALQRRPAATEAMALMMAHAFDAMGYRRYEWKCDALNAPSRAAAERLGFRFEGVFRQAVVTKGRSRDTAWYAVVDAEWPRLRAAFETWLDPANFDADGRQHRSLAGIRAGAP